MKTMEAIAQEQHTPDWAPVRPFDDGIVKQLQEALGPAVNAMMGRLEDAPSSRTGDGWEGAITCDACPVQIEGTVDGKHFYFRERGWDVSFGIGDTAEGAVAARHDGSGWSRRDEGDVTHSQAWGYVERWIAEWRAEGRP